MEDTKITFETAKLAKEKRFNETCNSHFEENCSSYDSYGEEFKPNDVQNHEILYARPTQSLLQRWLREVHNIIVTSKPYQDDVSNETDEDIEFQTLWENEILDVKDSYNIFSDNTFYHSYEEALEIGLQEALKLI